MPTFLPSACRTQRLARSVLLAFAILAGFGQSPASAGDESDPPEIAIGERLFLETRFAQSWAERPGQPDPVLQTAPTTGEPLPGPFRYATISCRACHLVDELRDVAGGGMRTYTDFARRSPIPSRPDGRRFAGRNSQALVDAAPPGTAGLLFHHDGEFASLEDLVVATLTGRNFGWLPGEQAQARAYVASVIRGDDGSGELAREFGGAYRVVLAGTRPGLPARFRLPEKFRIDVDQAGDAQIMAAVARLVAAYLADLSFARDPAGCYTGSPYDAFLKKNGLPRQPANRETPGEYSRRLLVAVNALPAVRFVEAGDGKFVSHHQSFAFGATELAGMKLFFARSAGPSGSAGNCVACHPAPHFTDFGFHNTGATQVAYDALHGKGAFLDLRIPPLAERNADPERWLPASESHPSGSGRFRAPAAADRPGETDLGAWNVLGNPDLPRPQQRLLAKFCNGKLPCSVSEQLPRAIAAFRTPGLRDLGHSAPYLHDGSLDSLQAVLDLYRHTPLGAREGVLRNPDPELAGVRIGEENVSALLAFLRALNEDYD